MSTYSRQPALPVADNPSGGRRVTHARVGVRAYRYWRAPSPPSAKSAAGPRKPAGNPGGPAVAIFVDPLDLDGFALDQVTEGLPGDVAERPGFFGGVDTVEPDLHLAVLAVEAGERVAAGDRDDLELLGKRGAGQG